MTLKLNYLEFDQKHTSRVDENRMCVNDCQGKPNIAEQQAKST